MIIRGEISHKVHQDTKVSRGNLLTQEEVGNANVTRSAASSEDLLVSEICDRYLHRKKNLCGCMASIRIKRVCEDLDGNNYVLVGEVDGSIGEGDFVRIPVTAEGNRMNFLISRIVAKQGETDWELHLLALPTIAKRLRKVQLVGRTFEVEDFRNE